MPGLWNASIEKIWQKLLFLEKISFLPFLDIERKDFNRLSEKFWWGFQNCNLSVHLNILTIKKIWRNLEVFNLFRTLKWNVWAFRRKIIGEVMKTAFYVSIGRFLRKMFFSVNLTIIYHFRTLSGNVSAFCQKIPARVVKTAFYVSIGKILPKNMTDL